MINQQPDESFEVCANDILKTQNVQVPGDLSLLFCIWMSKCLVTLALQMVLLGVNVGDRFKDDAVASPPTSYACLGPL